MKTACPEGDFGFFSADVKEEVLQIRFRENLLEHLSRLSNRDAVSNFVQQVEKSGNVKVVLLNSDFRDAGCEAYTRFILEQQKDLEKFAFHRLWNMACQLILGIISLDQMVIHACRGNVISLFLNISLACDYRIAADNTMFCNPYLDLGMIPMGGGPFFLSRFMGTGKAWELLLLEKDINAAKAKTLGLVDRVTPENELNAVALDIACRFAKNSLGTITGLKKLMGFSKRDLKPYFEAEKNEMAKIIHSADFCRQAVI